MSFALLNAGTNRDLMAAVKDGSFREDLLCRINLWAFALPGLRSRPEDIEPNLQFELDQLARKTGQRVTFREHDLICCQVMGLGRAQERDHRRHT
jgi:transcriptional regulatory protein RtcR